MMTDYVLTALLVTITAPSTAVSLEDPLQASYSEPCNATRLCLRRNWLGCTDGVCGCMKPDIMVAELSDVLTPGASYVSTAMKCGIKSGERCRFSIENGLAIYDIFPCVKNAKCDSEGFCACYPGHYEAGNGSCTKFRSHSQSCSDDLNLKCSPKTGLHCVDGVCECNSTISVYESNLSTCVGLVSGPCLNDRCERNAICLQGKCTCRSGNYLLNNSCYPKESFGKSCTLDTQCGQDEHTLLQLKCIAGRCNCDPSISVYGRVKKNVWESPSARKWAMYEIHEVAYLNMCAPKPNQPCAMGYCSPNSICNLSSVTSVLGSSGDHSAFLNATKPRCTCRSETIFSNSTGMCGKSLSSTCQGYGGCVDGLVCSGVTQGRCTCKYDSQVYNARTQRCHSKLNGPCSTSNDCLGDTLVCHLLSKNLTGHCFCKEGYTADSHKHCRLDYNQFCNYNKEDGECNSDAGLTCIESHCQCSGLSKYNKKLKKCVGLAGFDCKDDGRHSCIANASCVYSPLAWNTERPNSLSGFCQCNQGYEETPEYTCQAIKISSLTK